AAVQADHADPVAGANAEGDTVEQRAHAVALAHALEVDQVGHQSPRASSFSESSCTSSRSDTIMFAPSTKALVTTTIRGMKPTARMAGTGITRSFQEFVQGLAAPPLNTPMSWQFTANPSTSTVSGRRYQKVATTPASTASGMAQRSGRVM